MPSNICLFNFFIILPVIPKINCSIGSGLLLLKSTHVLPFKNIGRVGIFSIFSSNTGITGHFLSINSLKYASISSSCHGPIPLELTNTAAAPIFAICFSNSLCHGKPGLKFHSSSHGFNPYSFNSLPISFILYLSLLL